MTNRAPCCAGPRPTAGGPSPTCTCSRRTVTATRSSTAACTSRPPLDGDARGGGPGRGHDAARRRARAAGGSAPGSASRSGASNLVPDVTVLRPAVVRGDLERPGGRGAGGRGGDAGTAAARPAAQAGAVRGRGHPESYWRIERTGARPGGCTSYTLARAPAHYAPATACGPAAGRPGRRLDAPVSPVQVAPSTWAGDGQLSAGRRGWRAGPGRRARRRPGRRRRRTPPSTARPAWRPGRRCACAPRCR